MARPEGEWSPPGLSDPERPGRVSRPVVEGSGHIAACAVGACVVGVGSAVASWWLIGNQSPRNGRPDELQYVFRSPTIPHWVIATFGPVGLVAVVASLSWLVLAASRQVIDRRWLLVTGLLAIAGFLFAGIGRAATAGSIGANIGGGLGIMALPFVAGLVVWAAFIALRIGDARTPHPST